MAMPRGGGGGASSLMEPGRQVGKEHWVWCTGVDLTCDCLHPPPAPCPPTVGALLLPVGLKERLAVPRQRVLVHGEDTWSKAARKARQKRTHWRGTVTRARIDRAAPHRHFRSRKASSRPCPPLRPRPPLPGRRCRTSVCSPRPPGRNSPAPPRSSARRPAPSQRPSCRLTGSFGSTACHWD